MKRSQRTSWILIAVLSLAISSIAAADPWTYNGPRSTEELSQLLATSSDPAITGLSASTKASLVARMEFELGRPTGMSGTDANIQNLYATNGAQVLTAILGAPTILHTYESNPVTNEITTKALSTTPSTSAWSWCTNCYKPCKCCCCDVGGSGCGDNIAIIGGEYYSITDAETCTNCPALAMPGASRTSVGVMALMLGLAGLVVHRRRSLRVRAAA